MDKKILRAYLRRPLSRLEIVREFCRGKTVLDLGCVNHDIENTSNEHWLHQIIVDVASDTVGVDYLAPEVAMLKERGYKVMTGDVTKPLGIDRKFQVIVVGHLIEHLSNFEGLMDNLQRLLTPDGVVLICTPNPFFREQYFYTALKNEILVNPEHTCWIDPVTLDHLSRRFGLYTSEVRWIHEKWEMQHAILNGDTYTFDILTGRWFFPGRRPLLERVMSPLLLLAYRLPMQPERQRRIAKRYGKELGAFLSMKATGAMLEVWWRLRRTVIPTSDINRHEAYMSILKLAT